MADQQRELERIDKMLADGVLSSDEALRLRGAVTAKSPSGGAGKRWGSAAFVVCSTPLAVALFFALLGAGVWHNGSLPDPLFMATAVKLATAGTVAGALILWTAGIFLWVRCRKSPHQQGGLRMIPWFTVMNPLLMGGCLWFLVSATIPARGDEPSSSERSAKERAQARMKKDAALFSRQQLQEIEALYQAASKQWNTEEGKNSLKKLVEQYKAANRTGCALLYLGQMSKGEEQEKYLRAAIADYSDCYYGDGVQVGAYARYHLGWHYADQNQPDQANALFAEIRKNYPDAIAHNGKPLILPAQVLPKSQFHTAQSARTKNPADRYQYSGTFQDNPGAVGRWVSVDFVPTITAFQPGKKAWGGDLFLKELLLLPGGKTKNGWQIWTGDYLLHTGGDQSASRFTLKAINGKQYLFLEWMCGDVLLRGEAPFYYVMQRQPERF